MKKIATCIIFNFLFCGAFGQISNSFSPNPCTSNSYFTGVCYDSIHIVKFKSLNQTIFCVVCVEDEKENKNGEKYKQCNPSVFSKDSLIIILNHRKIKKGRIYRLTLYTGCPNLEPKILRIDCEKPPD